jgi:hypothetical protein
MPVILYVPATSAVFAGAGSRSSVIERLEGQAVSRCCGTAGDSDIVNGAGSGPRLFGDEASDIASELIAMTLLQQQKRVNRTAEKTVTHQGKDYLAEWHVDDVLVEGTAPRLV